jgi:hypothetical protein
MFFKSSVKATRKNYESFRFPVKLEQQKVEKNLIHSTGTYVEQTEL